MKTVKMETALLAAGLVSIALLGAALYLQHVKNMQPCPLCVLQRYAFAVLALICLGTFWLAPRARRFGGGLGAIAALTGAGIAARHLWIKAHPATSCGIDPLETSLNTIPSAQLLPFLFKADGLCASAYPPLLGLSIPAWSLTWFLALAIWLGWYVLRADRQ
jgi:protein dithiol:quinone oxidoreductase